MTKKPRHLAVHSLDFLGRFGIHSFRTLNKTEQADVLENYTKLLVVRNPLVRAFSSYRQKLGGGGCAPYMRSLGKKIIKSQRGQVVECGMGVTFHEFINYFSTHVHILGDRHWQRLDGVCQPCRIKYDHMLRLDTGFSDVRYFVEDILNEKLPETSELLQRNSRGSFDEQIMAENNYERVYKEFANLSVEAFSKVASYYEKSSRMFGYGSTLTDAGMLSSCRYHVGDSDCC